MEARVGIEPALTELQSRAIGYPFININSSL